MKSRTVSSSAAELGDKHCIYCGYNLRGLKASDKCPECGKLAVDSLLGDNLRDAEAPWVRTVLRGLTFLSIAYLVLIVDRLVAVAQWFVLHNFGPYSQFNDYFFYGRFVTFAGVILLTIGIWLATAREHSDALIARRRVLAWVLRMAVLLLLARHLWPVVRDLLVLSSKPDTAMLWCSSLGAVIVHGLTWLHVRRIIHRTPRHEIARLLMLTACTGVALFLLTNPAVRLNLIPGPWLALVSAILHLLHHALATYVAVLSGNAIRRTIGDWT